MKKSILYICGSFLDDSGANKIARNTYELFKKNNHDVYFYTSKGFYDIECDYSEYFPRLYNSPIKYLTNLHNYYYNFESAKKLAMLLDKIKPDIIHIHSLCLSSMTYSLLKSCMDKKIPTIMTLHDVSIICPVMKLIKGNGEYCHEYLCKGKNKLNCIINNCANKGLEESIRLSIRSFVDTQTHYNDYICQFISPSKALKNLILDANIGIDDSRIKVINNFLTSQENRIIPNYGNKGYFLFCGRLSKEKGVHYLLQAMKDLPKEIGLHIAGDGPYKNTLKQYVKEHNINNVEFLGFKNREEIKEEYQNCIATVLPCNWFENFPTTNMESFINGKPVIASNIGGIPEQIEHNKTGLLFEPANIEELKKCILKYWNNYDLVAEHGKNAYNKAKEQYTEERYYKELDNVYDSTITAWREKHVV